MNLYTRTHSKNRTHDKMSWQQTSGRQIDHPAISRRFRGGLEDIRNRKAADIGNLRHHYLMVAKQRLRTATIKQTDEMNRRAFTQFTRRFKSAETVTLFNKNNEEHKCVNDSSKSVEKQISYVLFSKQRSVKKNIFFNPIYWICTRDRQSMKRPKMLGVTSRKR